MLFLPKNPIWLARLSTDEISLVYLCKCRNVSRYTPQSTTLSKETMPVQHMMDTHQSGQRVRVNVRRSPPVPASPRSRRACLHDSTQPGVPERWRKKWKWVCGGLWWRARWHCSGLEIARARTLGNLCGRTYPRWRAENIFESWRNSIADDGVERTRTVVSCVVVVVQGGGCSAV